MRSEEAEIKWFTTCGAWTTSSSITWKFVRIEEWGDYPPMTYSIRSSRGGDPVVCGLTSHAGDSDAANFENHGYRLSSHLFSL